MKTSAGENVKSEPETLLKAGHYLSQKDVQDAVGSGRLHAMPHRWKGLSGFKTFVHKVRFRTIPIYDVRNAKSDYDEIPEIEADLDSGRRSRENAFSALKLPIISIPAHKNDRISSKSDITSTQKANRTKKTRNNNVSNPSSDLDESKHNFLTESKGKKNTSRSASSLIKQDLSMDFKNRTNMSKSSIDLDKNRLTHNHRMELEHHNSVNSSSGNLVERGLVMKAKSRNRVENSLSDADEAKHNFRSEHNINGIRTGKFHSRHSNLMEDDAIHKKNGNSLPNRTKQTHRHHKRKPNRKNARRVGRNHRTDPLQSKNKPSYQVSKIPKKESRKDQTHARRNGKSLHNKPLATRTHRDSLLNEVLYETRNVSAIRFDTRASLPPLLSLPRLEASSGASLEESGVPRLQASTGASLEGSGVPRLQASSGASLEESNIPRLDELESPHLKVPGVPSMNMSGQPLLANQTKPHLNESSVPTPTEPTSPFLEESNASPVSRLNTLPQPWLNIPTRLNDASVPNPTESTSPLVDGSGVPQTKAYTEPRPNTLTETALDTSETPELDADAVPEPNSSTAERLDALTEPGLDASTLRVPPLGSATTPGPNAVTGPRLVMSAGARPNVFTEPRLHYLAIPGLNTSAVPRVSTSSAAPRLNATALPPFPRTRVSNYRTLECLLALLGLLIIVLTILFICMKAVQRFRHLRCFEGAQVVKVTEKDFARWLGSFHPPEDEAEDYLRLERGLVLLRRQLHSHMEDLEDIPLEDLKARYSSKEHKAMLYSAMHGKIGEDSAWTS